jgi:hypothetical protein
LPKNKGKIKLNIENVQFSLNIKIMTDINDEKIDQLKNQILGLRKKHKLDPILPLRGTIKKKLDDGIPAKEICLTIAESVGIEIYPTALKKWCGWEPKKIEN